MYLSNITAELQLVFYASVFLLRHISIFYPSCYEASSKSSVLSHLYKTLLNCHTFTKYASHKHDHPCPTHLPTVRDPLIGRLPVSQWTRPVMLSSLASKKLCNLSCQYCQCTEFLKYKQKCFMLNSNSFCAAVVVQSINL